MPLTFQRPLEEGARRSLVPAVPRPDLGLGQELRPREQRRLRLAGLLTALVRVARGRDGPRFDDHRLGRTPAVVDEQHLGLGRDLLGLGEHRLDRAVARFASDDLPGERQHQVVAVVAVGGEAVFGELALDGEGALQLLRHELEGVGLEGVPVGHEDDLDGLGLADAPGAP